MRTCRKPGSPLKYNHATTILAVDIGNDFGEDSNTAYVHQSVSPMAFLLSDVLGNKYLIKSTQLECAESELASHRAARHTRNGPLDAVELEARSSQREA